MQTLNKMNIGATLTHGTGSTNEVDIIETVVGRKEMKTLERTLNSFDTNISMSWKMYEPSKMVSSRNGEIFLPVGDREVIFNTGC